MAAEPYISSGFVMLPEGENNWISRIVLKESMEFSPDDTQQHDDVFDMLMMAIDKGLGTNAHIGQK